MKVNAVKILVAVLLVILPLAIKAFWFEADELIFEEPKKIYVIDSGHYYEIFSSEGTVGEFLSEKHIVVREGDLIFPDIDSELTPNMNIRIERIVRLKIFVDGEELEVNTLNDTVGGAIRDGKIEVSHLDIVEPVQEEMLYEDMNIKITRIEIEEIVEEEKVKFKTSEKEDDELRWRKEKVIQEGVAGIKKVEYRLRYKDGKLAEKTKLNSEVIKEPTEEIIAIGTKIEVGKTKTGVASWYAYKGGMFCASRMFPRGAWLRVTNKATGKKIFVQVNDYGPMRGTGKMIDLDKVAFEKIANLGQGVVEVKVEEILE